MKNQALLAFIGDVSITGIFKDSVLENKEILDTKLLRLLHKQHYVIANLEGPATNSKCYERNNGLVVSPLCSIKYLCERNIKVFNLANNHIFDNGITGFKDTKEEITQNNCFCFGSGYTRDEASEMLFLEKNNITFGILGFSHKEGPVADDSSPGVFCIEGNLAKIKNRISKVRNYTDWIILNYHGGEEFTTIPMPSRRKLLHKLAKLDVDIIVCHHSHVVQGYELVSGVPVFYSLGNFIFDIKPHQRKKLVQRGIILTFEFSKAHFSFTFNPTFMNKVKTKVELANDGSIEKINSISYLDNYWKKWIIDANRTFFHTDEHEPGQIRTGKRHRPLFAIFSESDTITSLINLLISPNKRSIFIGAIVYRFLKLLGIKFSRDDQKTSF